MKLVFVFAFIFLFVISFVSADFSLGTPANGIKTSYVSGESVSGWINMSFDDEDFNATFTTSAGKNISLVDLLIANDLYEECGFANCEVDYSTSGGASTKTFSMAKGEEKLIGFKFDRDFNSLNSIGFTISSDALKSCDNQLKIDIFDDNLIDITNTKSFDDACSNYKTKGCFDKDYIPMGEVNLLSTRLCQKVRLPETPGFRLSIGIISSDTEEKSISFGLYDSKGGPISSCSNNLVTESGEYSCDIDGFGSNETRDYYVCASSNNVGMKINYYEDKVNGCGFAGSTFIEKGNYSYNISASTKQFDAFGEFDIQNDYLGNFLIEVQNYLISKYGSNLECSIKNCVVPFKIFSNVDEQQVTFDNLNGKIETDGGPLDILTDFYDLSEIPLKYDSGFARLYFDDFDIDSKDGSFWIKFNGQNVFAGTFSIAKFNSINSITPLITAATAPTEFKANVNIVQNVTNYKWDFGDGQVQSTNINSVMHTYGTTGIFNLTLTIFADNTNVSRSFEVIVDTPIKILTLNLQTKLGALEKIKNSLELLSTFHQNEIKKALDLTNVENRLTKIKIDFDAAAAGVADSFYIKLIGDLNNVSIPNSISVSKSAESLPFYFSDDNINLGALELLSGNYSRSNEQQYKDAILAWNLDNLVNTITYKEVSADYGGGSEILLNVFEIGINKNPDSDNTPFLILKKMEGLNFEKDYNKRELGDYIFIPINDANSKIVFSTTEDISFSELPLFISPQLENLNVLSISTAEEDNIFKWIFFGLIIFFLLLFAVVIYIVLQKWYSKRYESYLFKNKNDLYNLISFIENSKRKGVGNNKIIESLKKSGWSREQVNYIIKKYLGKRTGMLEIPVQKILKKKNTRSNSLQRPRFRSGVNFRRRGARRF